MSMQQPYAVEHTTLISKKFHASAGCYINKTFIFYPIHRHKVSEQSIFEQLIRDNNEISVHQRHLRASVCEVFKSLKNLNTEFMWSHFVFKNITCNTLLRLTAAKSTFYGINSVLFRACLLWNSLPKSVKYTESILELRTKKKSKLKGYWLWCLVKLRFYFLRFSLNSLLISLNFVFSFLKSWIEIYLN